MPCPFPGMDPYLEDPAVWPGLHDRLIVHAGDMLQPLVLPRYYVEIRERVYFEEPRDVIYPDATIRELRPVATQPVGTAMLAPDAPVVLSVETRQREPFLEIRAMGSNEVVTVIEFISPANKHGGRKGRDEYRQKQEQVFHSRASLVEIDLLRRGTEIVLAPSAGIRSLPRFDYLACVNRASQRERFEVYAFPLRERLPLIAIPLRAPDPDVTMDLPAIFTRCYDNGAYRVRIDYNQPPSPPLRRDDEAWADTLLREAGLRDEAGD
jgi:Protein of unknown function (DUF4058)